MANYNTLTLEQIEDVYTRVLETPNTVFVVESSRGNVVWVERLVWVSELDGETREYVRIYNKHSNTGIVPENLTFENFVSEVAGKANARIKQGKVIA